MAGRVQTRVQQRQFRNTAETAFVSLLVVAEHLNQRLDDVCGSEGITHTQYNVLRILRGAQPHGHPRFEIASRLIHRAPDVTRLLDRLDRQGLIERGWAPDNRRHSIARITPKGLQVLSAIEPQLRRLQDDTVGTLSPAQLATLVAALESLAP
jgi:DNA-binding MarR family transcriptional regulator